MTLREHESSLKVLADGTHPSLHCRDCGYNPQFTSTNVLILNKSKHRLAREITKAVQSKANSTTCSHVPSVALNDKEIGVLNS